MFVPYSRPLDLSSTLESGQTFRWTREDSSGPASGQWYQGVIFDNVVEIRHSLEGIELRSAPDDESILWPMVHDYLRLEDDLDGIYRSIQADARVDAAIARYRGMRIVRQDPWECLISFICSSNSNIPRISANVEEMSRSFGHPITLGDCLRYTFPTPAKLATAGERRLRELGLGFRAKYVAAVARIVAEGDMDLFTLREAPYDEALDALTTLPGVGDKVANCVMLFSLDKLEAFPVDVWIERTLQEWYLGDIFRGKKLSRKNMRLWAQDYFKPYAGYANQYLFHARRLQGKTTG